MTERELMDAAAAAGEHAYAPYSGYRVGAAALAETGNVYTGSNVENRSYGLTVCAERNAIFRAVNSGEKRITRVAVAAGDGPMPLPCGACLQVMEEFGVEEVLVGRSGGDYRTFTLKQLLPRPFGGE